MPMRNNVGFALPGFHKLRIFNHNSS
jgi:hypothetical protein